MKAILKSYIKKTNVLPAQRIDFNFFLDEEFKMYKEYLKGIKASFDRLKDLSPAKMTLENFTHIILKTINEGDFNFTDNQLQYFANIFSKLPERLGSTTEDKILNLLREIFYDKVYSINQVPLYKYNNKPGYNYRKGGPPVYENSEYVKNFYPSSSIAMENVAQKRNRNASW